MPVPDAHHPSAEDERTSSPHEATLPQDSENQQSTPTTLPSIGVDNPDDAPPSPSPTGEPGSRVSQPLPTDWYLPFDHNYTWSDPESEEDYFPDYDWVREMEGEAGVHWVLRAIIEEDYFIPYFAHRDAQSERHDAGETREEMEDTQAALGGEMQGLGPSDEVFEEKHTGSGDEETSEPHAPSQACDQQHAGSGDEETSEPDAPSQACDRQDTGSGDEESCDGEGLPEAPEEQDTSFFDERRQATGNEHSQLTDNEDAEAVVEEHDNPGTTQQPPVAPLPNHQSDITPRPTTLPRQITCGTDLVTPAEQPFRFLSGNQRRFHLHAHVDQTSPSSPTTSKPRSTTIWRESGKTPQPAAAL